MKSFLIISFLVLGTFNFAQAQDFTIQPKPSNFEIYAPDLTITSVNIGAAVGGRRLVHVEVRNQGTLASNPCEIFVSFFWKKDQKSARQSFNLGKPIHSLIAGGSKVYTFQAPDHIMFTTQQIFSTATLRLIVDADNQNNELNESNNQVITQIAILN